jgi:hypothetical protein
VPLEAIWHRAIQTRAVFVDGRIITVDSLHEHFDIRNGTPGAQSHRRVSRILAGTVVEFCQPLQHRKIERGRFPMREHTVDVDDG